MTREQRACPFKIGDCVKFVPDQHTYGWTWPSFDAIRLKPGDTGVVTRISQGQYLYLDDDRGGLHWECFENAE
jgi:hypothetical protein